jgi:hypothetical protein
MKTSTVWRFIFLFCIGFWLMVGFAIKSHAYSYGVIAIAQPPTLPNTAACPNLGSQIEAVRVTVNNVADLAANEWGYQYDLGYAYAGNLVYGRYVRGRWFAACNPNFTYATNLATGSIPNFVITVPNDTGPVNVGVSDNPDAPYNLRIRIGVWVTTWDGSPWLAVMPDQGFRVFEGGPGFESAVLPDAAGLYTLQPGHLYWLAADLNDITYNSFSYSLTGRLFDAKYQ